jgi:hypothetical protein
VATVACAALVFFTYRALLDLPLIGFDTYPLIAAARVSSFGDLLGTFTEELMDGRYTDGHFYRPVTNIVFALDHALWGLAPRGYHVTDLLITSISGGLLFAVARRLFGRRRLVAGAIAATVLVLHPMQMELMPVAPRRADALALLFTLATLSLQPRAGERMSRGVALGSLVLAFCAGASKESGAVVAPLVLGLHLLHGEARGLRAAGSAAARSLPAITGVALYVGARALVLRGLGGHADSSLDVLTGAAERARVYARHVLLPQPLVTGAAGTALLWLTALALVLALVVVWRRPGTDVERERRDVRRAISFLVLWLGCVFVVSSLAGRVHTWYTILFVAPYALALGLCADRGLSALRRERAREAWLPLAVAVVLAGSHCATSMLLRPYTNLFDAGKLVEQTYAQFDRVLAREPGRVLEFNPWVWMLEPHSDGSEVKGLYLYWDYTMQAYAELTAPDKTVELRVHPSGAWPAHPNVLRIVLVPGPRPPWIALR